MKAVIQRVERAAVEVDGTELAAIGPGLLVLLGIEAADTSDYADALAEKVARLRVFADAEGRMNLSVTDLGGAVLVVPNFTLVADTGKGNRPSYAGAAAPAHAEPLFERFRAMLGAEGGRFGAHMKISLLADGPVTLLLNVGG